MSDKHPLFTFRKARGLSCRDVQDATGIHFTTVAAQERGDRTPTGAHLALYRELYGLTAEQVDEVIAACSPSSDAAA